MTTSHLCALVLVLSIVLLEAAPAKKLEGEIPLLAYIYFLIYHAVLRVVLLLMFDKTIIYRYTIHRVEISIFRASLLNLTISEPSVG